MKKIIIFLLIILVIIGSGAGIVFAMTGIKEIPKPEAYVIKVEGEARIKGLDDDGWLDIKKDIKVVVGDTIKTGQNGQVSINFYDGAVSRIGPNSEVSFDKLFIDEKDYTKTKVDIFVEVGRVWSRIINLADRQASFEVSSSVTVATIRGTAFDFAVTYDGITEINAAENIIEIAAVKIREEKDPATGKKKKIKEVIEKVDLSQGQVVIIDREKKGEEKIIIEPISTEVAKSEWFKGNQQSDKEFKEEVREKQEKINAEIAGVLPDSGMYKFKRIAENTRVALTRDKAMKQKIAIAFNNKRLTEAQELARKGKVALAESTVGEWQKSIDKLKIDPEIISREAKNQFNLQKQIARGVTPDSSLYNLKIIIENLEITNEPNQAAREHLKLKQIKERIEEAIILKERGEDNLLDEHIKTIEEMLKEAKNLPEQELRGRLEVMKELLKDKEDAGDASTQEPGLDREGVGEEDKGESGESAESHDSSSDSDNTSTQDLTGETGSDSGETENDNNNPPDDNPPDDHLDDHPDDHLDDHPDDHLDDHPDDSSGDYTSFKILDSVTVTADKYNMITGDIKQFTATAYYSDGSSQDVTAEVIWSLSGDIGAITPAGLLQTDADGGKGTININLTEEGVTVSASSFEITALALEF